MKVIILAGGRGTRLAEETGTIPKPMVKVGEKPILWHIMESYARYGHNDFLIATGYLSEVIDDWVSRLKEPWTVETLFTGLETQTGGRIKQCLENSREETVMATYGDGLANVDISALISFHNRHSFKATLTAVKPPARFGVVEIQDERVAYFGEKQQSEVHWINGGFFVLERSVLDFISSPHEPFETEALPRLASKGFLGAFRHQGFWKPMDTLREKQEYDLLAKLKTPPWQSPNCDPL
jgi:glucose-1-phosphate cytidylyltransferase